MKTSLLFACATFLSLDLLAGIRIDFFADETGIYEDLREVNIVIAKMLKKNKIKTYKQDENWLCVDFHNSRDEEKLGAQFNVIDFGDVRCGHPLPKLSSGACQ